MSMKLQGKVAVVTGAASGIGREIAKALAKKGCELALVDINVSCLAESAAEVGSYGLKVSTFVVDVCDKMSMQQLPEIVVAAHGGVHILVNNAGVSVTDWFSESRIEDFEWAMGTNFWGMVYACKFFLPYLAREEQAHIVNVSSSWGLLGIPTQTAYCASKFAARGFGEALIADLYGTHVGVTLVHPGSVATNIVRASRMRDVAFKEAVARNIEKAMPPMRGSSSDRQSRRAWT